MRRIRCFSGSCRSHRRSISTRGRPKPGTLAQPQFNFQRARQLQAAEEKDAATDEQDAVDVELAADSIVAIPLSAAKLTKQQLANERSGRAWCLARVARVRGNLVLVHVLEQSEGRYQGSGSFPIVARQFVVEFAADEDDDGVVATDAHWDAFAELLQQRRRQDGRNVALEAFRAHEGEEEELESMGIIMGSGQRTRRPTHFHGEDA